MVKSLTLNAIALPGQRDIELLSRDIQHVVKQYSRHKILLLFVWFGGASVGETAKSKVVAVKKSAAFIKNTVNRYGNQGIKNAALSDVGKIKAAVINLPRALQGRYNKFVALTLAEQREEIASLVLTVLVFCLISGGRDLEGGLPDTDIALVGIGNHRNIFSHTLLLGLGFEVALRIFFHFIEHGYSKLPADHHPLWDSIHRVLDKSGNRTIGAAWLGIGAHLAQDASLFTDSIKPLTWLPGSYSMGTHQLILAANALASSALGYHSLIKPKTINLR